MTGGDWAGIVMRLGCRCPRPDGSDTVATLAMQWGWSPTGIHVEHVDGWPGWKFQVTPTRDGGVARISMTAPPDHVITLDEFRRAPYGLLRRLCGSSTALSQASAIVPDPDALVPYSRK